MKILMVGAGATGGFFGAKLTQAGRDLTFLVRPTRAEILRERGLRLSGVGVEARIEPQLLTAGQIPGPFDVVIFSVKATALASAIEDASPAVGPDTCVIPFLNGMAHLDGLSERFGSDNVLAGAIRIAAELNQDGDVVVRMPGASMEIGAQDGRSPETLDQLAGEFSGAGFDFSISDDAVGAMWHKWVFIATVGAMTCMMRAGVGDIIACPLGPDLGPTILAEAAAISAAAGYPVPAIQIEATTAAVTQQGSRLNSSMYRDMSQDAPTEVEQILGDLVSRARTLGLSTPVLDLATLHLRVYERRRA